MRHHHGFLAVLLSLASCRPNGAASVGYVTPARGSDGTVARAVTPRIAAAMHARYLSQGAHREPAVALTPTDGSELVLESLRARVTISGPLARTELHFTFHNPEARVREGRFSLVLPPDAAVGRLGMMVHGTMREARVVSREQGRRVFEQLLHRGIDPALLEQDVGNAISARVFPIFADEHKQIVIGYDHRVAESEPYVLPLAGLAPTRELTVAIEQDGAQRVLDLSGQVADDLVLAPRAGTLAVAGDDGAFVARIDAPVHTAAAPFERTMILVDTSASRATVLVRQADLLRRALAALPATSQVIVAAYDTTVTELYRGAAASAGHASDAMLAHGALGASNLEAALAHAAASGATRLILVGDGVPTLGTHEPTRLAALVAGKLDRVDAIQLGASLDRGTLEPIVRSGRVRGAIVDGRDPARAMRQLAMALPLEQPIQVGDAIASWPATTRGLAPGEPIWVYGRRAPDARALVVDIGARQVVLLPTATRAPVARMVARAELAALAERLVASPAAERPTIAKQIETIALAHFLVSSQTSLIVLESDHDEQRYLGAAQPPHGISIDRDQLRNIPVPGRTFEAALGVAAGSQADSYGISFSGSTSALESAYIIDGINTSGVEMFAEYATPLSLDLSAERIRSTAFAFGGGHADGARSQPRYAAPHEGALQAVLAANAAGERERALELATAWQLDRPGDVAAIIALGESLEARGAVALAARAYTSLGDLYPGRVELVRTAGARLDRLAKHHPPSRAFAIDAYRRALRERPDHATGYRLLAWALVRDGRLDEALDVLGIGVVRQTSPNSTYVLAKDAGLVGAAIVAREPGRRASVMSRMRYGIPDVPSVRFVLSWESDANDMDLHVRNRHGAHASAGTVTSIEPGSEPIENVWNGYGPELFVAEHPTGFPYKLAVHYVRKGSQGLGLGTVQVIHHDGRGTLTVEDRPFVIENDNAMLDLGDVRAP